MLKRLWPLTMFLLSLLLPGIGCKSASVTEVRGKTAFGPEFRNFGTNTSDIRYTAIQGVDLKWSNDWTTGVLYQRRDVDEGSGDNENLVLFEVGYPIWNAPKKPEKTVQQIQIRELENELRVLGSELAVAENSMSVGTLPKLVQADDGHRQTPNEKGE